MRGQKELNSRLFYLFSLHDQVPQNHLLRRLLKVLDWKLLRQDTAQLYGYNGHVSVDPVVIFKILLLGYLYNITSIRELMRQIEDRLSFRWFIGYDIDEKIPDHSVISKARQRFGPELFAQFFDYTVRLCREAGLVGGQLVHADSSKIQANASLQSVRDLHPGENFCPDLAPREYWDALEAQEKQEFPLVNQRQASTTDPDAAITSQKGQGRALTYSDHRIVDDLFGVILQTQATPGDVGDEEQFKPLLHGLIFRQGIIPQALAADRWYGSSENLKELEDKGIIAYIARKRPAHKPGKFSKNDFTYLPDEDRYLCPAGQRLLPLSKPHAQRRIFRGTPPTCASCALRKQCTNGQGPRTVNRHANEETCERAQQRQSSAAYLKAIKRRQVVIEGSFGDAKDHHAHRRARWRGLPNMSIQCSLVALVQNLKKLLKYACKPISAGANSADFGLFSVASAAYARTRQVLLTLLRFLELNAMNHTNLNPQSSVSSLLLEKI